MSECTICASTKTHILCRKNGATYHVCRECRAIFQYPQPSPEEMVNYVDAEYEDGVYRDYVNAREMKLEQFRRRISLLLPHVRRGRLLDIGCSCGYFIEVAAQSGFEVEGLEFSRVAVAAANPAIRPYIHCGTLEEFETSRTYDLVTAFDVIEHVPQPKQFMKKIRGLLAPGGSIAMVTPDPQHFLRYLMGSAWPMLQPMQHLTIFSRQSMHLALAECGFTDVSIETATKILTYEYLAEQLRALTPSLHRGMQLVGHCLSARTRHKCRDVNIGEYLALAKAAGA